MNKQIHFNNLGLVLIVCANVLLLLWIGVGVTTLLGSYLIQMVWTFAGTLLVRGFGLDIKDPILYWLTAWCCGLVLFFSAVLY